MPGGAEITWHSAAIDSFAAPVTTDEIAGVRLGEETWTF